MLHLRGLQGKEKIPLKGSGVRGQRRKGQRTKGKGQRKKRGGRKGSLVPCPVPEEVFAGRLCRHEGGGRSPRKPKTEQGVCRAWQGGGGASCTILLSRTRFVQRDSKVLRSANKSSRDRGPCLQHFDSYCIICYTRILDRPPRRVAYPAANNRRGILWAPRP